MTLEPARLYIHRLSTGGWKTPDRADPRDFWRLVRGLPTGWVRAVYEVPPEKATPSATSRSAAC